MKISKDMFEGIECLTKEPLSRHSTFRIGGDAELYLLPKDEKQIKKILAICKKKYYKYFILGNGSNLLFSDLGFSGVIIDLKKHFRNINIKGELVNVQAGVGLPFLARILMENGLSGFEELAGIPGTVGGALRQNASCYNNSISDKLVSVKVMNQETEEVFTLNKSEISFSYRYSSLKNFLILEASFMLFPQPQDKIHARMYDIAKKRKSTQPLNFPSAGSIFKRSGDIIPAKLIDLAGLKGFSCGDAQVSCKHAGFIINAGNATSQDVISLINKIKNCIKDKFGTELFTEVELVS